MTTEIVTLAAVNTNDPALAAALAVVEESRAITIKTTDDRLRLEAVALRINSAIKVVKALTQPPVDAANAHADAMRAHRDKYLVPLEGEKKAASRKIGDALAEDARKAEVIRQQAEAKALAEQLARQKADAEAQAAKAEVLAKAGMHEEADAAMNEAVEIEQAAPAPVYVAPVQAVRTQGVSAPIKDWKFRITDAAKVPLEYQVPDEVKIGKVVKAMKGAITIPGVEVYSENRAQFR